MADGTYFIVYLEKISLANNCSPSFLFLFGVLLLSARHDLEACVDCSILVLILLGVMCLLSNLPS